MPYNIDPACLTQQAVDGTAELITDPQSPFWAKLFAGANGVGGQGYEDVSAAGALARDVYETALTVSGTKAYTLAAPTVIGQRKRIVCVSAASTPLGTVTITSPDDTAGFVCASAFTFTTVGQAVELQATAGLKWRATHITRAGILTGIVAGTTVLTALNLVQAYSLAVDGTDAGTGAGGLPNGSCVGEQTSIVCELAANTPVGSLSGTYVGMFGTAYTACGAIGVVASATAVGDFAFFEWTGSAWRLVHMAGVTMS
jgi:hypothetical protein